MRSTVEDLGVEPATGVGASAFTTIDPGAQLAKLARFVEDQPTPPLVLLWVLADEYESYEVLTGRYTVPGIQGGERPYEGDGEGLIVWDGDMPAIQDTQDVRLALTVSRRPMPPGGFPLLVCLHGSGGSGSTGSIEDPEMRHSTPTQPLPGRDPRSG